MPAMSSTTVYRLFSASDDLLYVGCTLNGATRIENHRPREWWPEVCRIELTHCESSEAARALETDLIRDLHPRYNRFGRVPTVSQLRALRDSEDGSFPSQALMWLAHRRGLNRRTLALRAGLCNKTVYDIGRPGSGGGAPTDDTLLALGRALEMSPLLMFQILSGEVDVEMDMVA